MLGGGVQTYDLRPDVTGYNAALHAFRVTAGYALPPGVTLDGGTGVLTFDDDNRSTASAQVKVDLIPSADYDYQLRASGSQVVWAHDFSESVNELEFFVRNGAMTNPDPADLPNPLSLIDSGLGSSKAIRSRMVGAAFTQTTPEGVAGDSHVVNVIDSSRFPDLASFGVYQAIIGHPDGACHEKVNVTARDTVNNTLTITRRVTSDSMPNVNGVAYPYPAAPPYTAGWSIGLAPSGSWNRPFAGFPAGQNGRAVDDAGLSNGAALIQRSWLTARDNSAHTNFREAYYGSRWYWDPAVNPAAPYKNWTPPAGGATRINAFEGDEFYLQFRMRLNAARVGQSRRKMFFIQNAATSGPGQIFMHGGEQRYAEQPAPAERIPGITYGYFPFLQCGGGDGRQTAGGLLFSDGQFDSIDSGGGNHLWQTDYPLGYWYNRLDTDCFMFCFPADTWVTYLIHVKFGRDNAEAFHPLGDRTTEGVQPPFMSESDASYRTTVELKVHMPGWADYKTLSSAANLTWFFGDDLDWQGYLYYNAPGENAIWLAENPNMYIGTGSSGPVPDNCDVDYTQVIFSKGPIPVPSV